MIRLWPTIMVLFIMRFLVIAIEVYVLQTILRRLAFGMKMTEKYKNKYIFILKKFCPRNVLIGHSRKQIPA